MQNITILLPIVIGEIQLIDLFKEQRISSLQKNIVSKNTVKLVSSFLLTVATWGISSHVVKAQTANNVPNELAEIVTEIETAANEQDLDQLMKYYDADFTNEDGLTTESVKEALAQMWETYPELTYETTINSWSEEGDELVAETVTQITGSQNSQGRVIQLKSNLKSRQYFRDQKLVRQEILAEETQLSTGDRPPQVKVNVPETVKVGEKYNFDTIVTDPLETNVLLGTAVEERTGGDRYLNPTTLELEPLSAGGIFKIVTAPRLSDNHWLSAIIVRGDGITMVTKRVRIEE